MLARVRSSDCHPSQLVKRSYDKQAALFRLLADCIGRGSLLPSLRLGMRVCVCDLTAGLPLEQPTVSHHLRVLRTAGLVTSERRGTWVCTYRLAAGAKALLADAVAAVLEKKSTGAPRKRLAS